MNAAQLTESARELSNSNLPWCLKENKEGKIGSCRILGSFVLPLVSEILLVRSNNKREMNGSKRAQNSPFMNEICAAAHSDLNRFQVWATSYLNVSHLLFRQLKGYENSIPAERRQ